MENYNEKDPIDCIFTEFDILGFKDIVKNNEKRLNIQQIANSYHNYFINNVIESNKNNNTDIKFQIFSDTVLLYLEYGSWSKSSRVENYKKNIYNYFNLLSIIMCNSVLLLNSKVFPNVACNITGSFPIRGGIASGSIVAEAINSNYPILIGEPIIDAYEWEQQQNWLGISISPTSLDSIKSLMSPNYIYEDLDDFWSKLISDNLLIKYGVPVKVKKENRVEYVETYVVNFVPSEQKYINMIKNALLEKINTLSSDPLKRIKYEETVKFVDFIISKKLYIEAVKFQNDFTVIGCK